MVRNKIIATLIWLSLASAVSAQEFIPFDTAHWNIRGKTYLTENYKGKDAIYLRGGNILLKNTRFLNGTIEYDVFLKEEQAFPGVYFRAYSSHAEQFFLRPHLSGKPDANQAAPLLNGITPWQLYFGPKYSFAYEYNYDDWTHVKLVVNGDRAQVFLDYSETPHLSWNLFHETRAGQIVLTAGGASAMHLANITVDENATTLVDFKPGEREPIEGLIQEWQVSDMFEEKELDDLAQLKSLINGRKWDEKIQVEEGTAANISRARLLFDGTPANTVFAKVTINADSKMTRLFEFGYSDRVVAILNGKPIYRGSNKWRSRDYRYLGTVGLFDSVYLNLKKGENTLLFAVSEDFGGWLITGRFADDSGLTVK
ncbi:MAG: hypothetical protein HEP71_24985 [Roseivirga sp.]|nr:hypothetical protein [Roseivirga sp.]